MGQPADGGPWKSCLSGQIEITQRVVAGSEAAQELRAPCQCSHELPVLHLLSGGINRVHYDLEVILAIYFFHQTLLRPWIIEVARFCVLLATKVKFADKKTAVRSPQKRSYTSLQSYNRPTHYNY